MNDSGCLAIADPMGSRTNLPFFLHLSALTSPDTTHMAPRNHRDILRLAQTGSGGKTSLKEGIVVTGYTNQIRKGGQEIL